MIKGSIPALVTPMCHDDGGIRLDLLKFGELIEWHIEQGSDGLVIVGTTGESPTVDFKEHKQLIRTAVAAADGRIPIIAGTGANSTQEAIELARFAKQAGADAHLSVVPYYNKPTQDGLYEHFKTISQAVALPLILYNVPGRTVADLDNETVLRLAELPNICGIKDATGNMLRGADLINRCPQDFAIYSGDDGSTLALTLLGGQGCISVTANVAPQLMHQMINAAMLGDMVNARQLNAKLAALHRDLFVEANPIPVKWACAHMGLIDDDLRLPLTKLSNSWHARVLAALRVAEIKV